MEQNKEYTLARLILRLANRIVKNRDRHVKELGLTTELNRSLSSRQTKKQKILLKMVSVICRGHLFMQHPASYGNSLVRGNLDDADAVGSCSNE